MDNPSAPGGKSWVGADFSSQQGGGGAQTSGIVRGDERGLGIDGSEKGIGSKALTEVWDRSRRLNSEENSLSNNTYQQGGGFPNQSVVSQPAPSLAGLSSQAAGMPMAPNQPGSVQVMPMAPNQGMVQAPQSMPMAPGLNSLSKKAKKPGNITLNQMYRK